MKYCRVYILLLFLGVTMNLSAQYFSLSMSSDLGKNQLAEGVFYRPSAMTSYGHGNYFASTGFQWTFSQADRQVFSAWQTSFGMLYMPKEYPFYFSLFSLINPYSDLSREVNVGFILSHQREHLLFRIGNASRIYALKKSAISSRGITPEASRRIVEYRNFTYQLLAYLNNKDKSWNLGAGISNIDNFRVQQETNPMLLLSAYTRIITGLSINLDFWYQGAGMLNLSADYFGYYGRIGIIWIPGLNK